MAREPGQLDPDGPHGAQDSETTPLLASTPITAQADTALLHESPEPVADVKPFPLGQVLLLCFTRVVEPVAFFCIFPFVNQMIEQNGHLEEADVGFYTGLIESLFSLTQMIVMVPWGRAADKYGRKPILTLSLAGVTVATAAFGFAQTIWQMILLRCLAGVFAGTVVTIRTMIYEQSTPETQARSFSWFAVTGNLGIFLGPLIAGVSADPATQYGGVFKDMQFFNDYPYALPTIICAAIGAVATLASALFIEETLTAEKRAAAPKDERSMSTWELLKAPGVAMVIYIEAHVMLLAFMYTAATPVFWYTSVRRGGYGFSELQMALFMALGGFSQAFWLLLVFPPLHKRIGTGGIMRACGYAYPFFLGSVPFIQLLLRDGGEGSRIVFWTTGPVAYSIGSGVSMSFTAIQLAVNDVCPSPHVLGTLNALALAVISGIRAFAPIAITSIFAIGVKYQIVWGYLAWVVMAALGAGFTIAALYLPENADSKPYRSNAESAQEGDG